MSETAYEKRARLYGRCSRCDTVASGKHGLCARHRKNDRTGYEPSGSPRTLRLTAKGRAAIGVADPPVSVPLLTEAGLRAIFQAPRPPGAFLAIRFPGGRGSSVSEPLSSTMRARQKRLQEANRHE